MRIDFNAGSGTGFVFETTNQGSAYILTNYHVIEGASRVNVTVNDSNTYQAKVLGYDAYQDLAVLEICCGSFRLLELSDSSDVKAGTEVVAIGYPLDISGTATVTRGIVSAVRYDEGYRSWVIQTDAPINYGNSGGPLLLTTGEVIGVNTFIYEREVSQAEGLGFAIAEQSIKGTLTGLKQGTKVGFPTPTPSPTTARVRWQTYNNWEFDYTIDVRSDWTIDDGEKDYVYFNSSDDFAGAVMFVPDYQIYSSADRLSDYVEGLRPDYLIMEVLEEDTSFFDSGGEGSYIRYRSQYSAALCVEDNYDWLWVYDSKSYWLSFSVCEHSFGKYGAIFDSMLDSLSFN